MSEDAAAAEMPRITVEYEYTVALARRGTWRYLWRYGRKAVALAGMAFAIGVIRTLSDIRDQFTVGLLLMPALVALSWYVSIRRAAKLAHNLSDRRVVVSVDNEGVTFQTTDRTSFTTWSSLKAVWKFSDVCLFFPYGADAGTGTIVPVEALSPAATTFISAKLVDHATRVRA